MVEIREYQRLVRFECGRCDTAHQKKTDAEKCCSDREPIFNPDAVEEFELKQIHLDLFKNMVVGWQDCEYGAPEIDPKRPYGNSDVEDDIAEICKIEKTDKNYDEDEGLWREKISDQLSNLHRQMETALEIVLQTQTFELGTYIRVENKWQKK